MKPNGWASHYQHGWALKAVDDRWNVPLWQRVSFLAYARHEANGHAPFEPGEIGKILGRNDPSNLSNAIREAVRLDWLDVSSCAQCLVVPAHLIFGGLGNAEKRCEFHAQKLQNRKANAQRNAARRSKSKAAITSTIDSSQFMEVDCADLRN